MLTLVANNTVRDVLSSLGFASDADNPNEIIIDRFDHWTNKHNEMLPDFACSCIAVIADPERSAA